VTPQADPRSPRDRSRARRDLALLVLASMRPFELEGGPP
jgi:hypothetical protein